MKDRKAAEIERKDTRRTLLPEESIAHSKPQNSKKNTKKWCKGKEGKEHQTKCVGYNEVKRFEPAGNFAKATKNWKLLICTVCGKELDHFYAFGKQDPPDWAK